MAIYIDDGLIAGNKVNIYELIDYLKRIFEVKVYEARCFLGLDIERQTDGSIFLQQSTYADRILVNFKMNDANPVATPADGITYKNLANSNEVVRDFPYREAVGSLMYLAIGSRPDISYALGVVSRHLDKPTTQDIAAVKRLLRYVKGTRLLGILFQSNKKLIINCYSDADYAGDVETRRSTSGFVFLLGESPISWSSQRQQCVALSTMEAEYMAGSHAVKEIIWLLRLMNELLEKGCGKPNLFLDNQSAIKLIRNPEYHKRSKHIEVRFHFIREKFAEGIFDLNYVSTEDQLADIFTKPLPRNRFELLRHKIGVTSKSPKTG